jgi:hypothetical protein
LDEEEAKINLKGKRGEGKYLKREKEGGGGGREGGRE